MGLKIRHDLAANWTSVDPTLEMAEQGFETDTGKTKIGDGVTAWTSLAYQAAPGGYYPGGTDVAVADGGTGASTASGARTNLGLVIGTDVVAPNQDTTGKSAKTDALNSATTVVNVAAATAPTAGQVLTATSGTAATWQTAAGAAAWGSITGTLSSQTDLNTALGLKLAIANNLSDLADATTARWNIRVPSQSRCIVVSVANQTLSGTVTIDGVALVANNRVLLTGQSTGSENGIWQVQAGAWTRPADFPAAGVIQACIVLIAGGTVYASSVWGMTHTGNLTIDSGSQTWAIVNSNAPQTLTNKTLTSPAITTPTGLVESDISGLVLDLAAKQPIDSDLTAIAGLTATSDNFIQSKSSAWASRTVAQVKTDLGLTGTNTGDQTITLTGDVTGTGTGSFAATIANDAVTYAKMQNVSATDKLLGRSTAGAGDVEEIALTAAGRALIDDAAAVNQRTTLGLVIGTDVLAPSGSGASLTGIYVPGGTDVAITDGGTGSSTAGGARTNLGLVIGTDVVAPNQDTTGKSAKTDALNSATTVVNVAAATAPTNGQVLTATSGTAATWQTPSGGGGSGTVTTVSVVSANGLAGTVATATTTPAITLTTGITGVLKGNGTAISAAALGTDYYGPTGTDVPITDGGTGVSTLPTGLLVGAGTSAITAVTAPAGAVLGTTDTQTITNKRKQPRVNAQTSTATLTPEIDTYDVFRLTAQAATLTIANHSTSTPADGEYIEISILDNGTARGISFGTNYVARGGLALPTSTAISKLMTLGFKWYGHLSKWVLLANASEV